MAKLGLDLTNVQEERQSKTDFIKSGNYNAKIFDTEIVETKTGGAMLVIYLEVLEGEFKGSRVCDRLNIVNNSAEATRIGLSRLKLISRIAGIKKAKIDDSSELHGATAMITVIEDKFTSNGKEYDTNKIVAYAECTSIAKPAQTPAPAAQTEEKKFPWQK